MLNCFRLPSLIAKMKFTTLTAAVLPIAASAMFTKEEYESGVVMAKMMSAKEVCNIAGVDHSSQC